MKLNKHICAKILQYFTGRGRSVDNVSVSYRPPRRANPFVKFSFFADLIKSKSPVTGERMGAYFS